MFVLRQLGMAFNQPSPEAAMGGMRVNALLMLCLAIGASITSLPWCLVFLSLCSWSLWVIARKEGSDES